MTTIRQNPKKANKKSQIVIAYKTDASRKSMNHKEKIVNAIKKSTLKPFHEPKSRKSIKNRNSISNTDHKKKSTTSQIQSHRTRANKTMSSISKTVPIKYCQKKLLEFPFEAIKFKNHADEEKPNQNKTHDEFYIRYDEPELGEMDMKVLQNSKKIIGSHNQRIGRYSEQKARNKIEFGSGLKNIEFKESVWKLFRFLDPHGTRVISHTEIDYRKVPQAVLYFLGGLFQRIRQRNLYLSQKEFQQECQQIYLRSSNEDVNWFIEEVKLLSESIEQRPKQMAEKIVIKNVHTEGTHKNISQESKVEVSIQANNPQSLFMNNLSFDQESSVISFRRESKESPNIFEEHRPKDSCHLQRQSYQSAQFGQPVDHHRFSFNANERMSFGMELENNQSKNSKKSNTVIEETISLAEMQKQLETKNQSLRSGIKKNGIEKVEDMREQIYAKLDKLKIAPEVKENSILRDNFKINSGRDTLNVSSKREQPKQNFPPGSMKNYRYTDTFTQENKPLEKTPLCQQKDFNQLLNHFKDQPKAQIKDQTRQSGWISKAENCDKAFNELQKIRDQFNKHKNTIETRQAQRESYFKDENNKKILPKNQDLILQQETRVLKLIETRPPLEKTLNKENKENLTYQRNIDRLLNLSNSRDRNPLTINLNETLSNSCRKSVEVSLPLKSEMYKGISFSDKKPTVSSKIDKIDELSSKLQQYLMKNAEKIEYSKNFTEKTGPSKFNKLLAL